MARIARNFVWPLMIGLLLLVSASTAKGQGVVVTSYYTPSTSYYYPAAPVVAYSPATVSYYAPSVAYYPTPSVSYYAAPATTYSTGAVTATRYGLFGRPRRTATYYSGYVIP
jgi:hypothetical protein